MDEDRDDHGVDARDAGGFSRGEDAAIDAAENDHRREQRPDRLARRASDVAPAQRIGERHDVHARVV
jgi:hypothetical protein